LLSSVATPGLLFGFRKIGQGRDGVIEKGDRNGVEGIGHGIGRGQGRERMDKGDKTP